MNLYIVFGQRRERYEGEMAPEALAVMDEFSYDENSQWLHKKEKEYAAKPEFVAVRIVKVELSASVEDLRAILVGVPEIQGEVEG